MGPYATLLKATQAANSYFDANGQNVAVSVYVEPGTYNSAWGDTCAGASCSTGCNSTVGACTAMQVIEVNGSQDYPITIENDPDNQGDVIFERPAGAGASTQQTNLVTVWDSTWVNLNDLQLEGVQSSDCGSGTCGGTGCASSCVNTNNNTGELNVTYDSATAAPSPGSDSGISVEGVSIADTDFTCLMVSYAEYVDVEDSSFTNCGTPGVTGQHGVYLGAGYETVQNNDIEHASGYGVFSNTVNSSYPAVSQTISGNTLAYSGRFGSSSGPGAGGSTVFSGNSIYGNGSGGLQVDWGAAVQNNVIYENLGPGLQLDWFDNQGCGCENVIQNNTFYEDTGEEIDSSKADYPEVTLEYNIFYLSSGEFEDYGGLRPCYPGGNQPELYSTIDSNDIYPSSGENVGGAGQLNEDPSFVSTPPEAMTDLEAMNIDLATNGTTWGSRLIDPHDAGDPVDTLYPTNPTEVAADELADNVLTDILAWDNNNGGTGDANLPTDLTVSTDTSSDIQRNAALSPAPDAIAWGSDGWGWAHAIEECPEPFPGSEANGGNDYGLDGHAGNPCSGGGRPFESVYPHGPVTSGWGPCGAPSASNLNPCNLYGSLCGPGSATTIVHTLEDQKVDDWREQGWYRFLYDFAHGKYGLRWAEKFQLVGLGGWNTFWQGELKFINHFRHGQKPYRVDKIYHLASNTSAALQRFKVQMRDDLQVNRGRRRALMAAVDTINLPGWGTTNDGFSHYVAIIGYNGGTKTLAYMDTAWGGMYGQHEVDAEAFLGNILNSTDAYNKSGTIHEPRSDKVVLW